jgi:hypothetical protein
MSGQRPSACPRPAVVRDELELVGAEENLLWARVMAAGLLRQQCRPALAEVPLMTDASQHPSHCTCRAHPLPASMLVRDALEHYLAENGFTREGYTEKRSEGSLLGLKLSVPNPPSHQRALRLHDLHHVATGFGTDHAGEAEISVWQARRGLRTGGHYVAAIILANVVIGLLAAPRRTIAALWLQSSGGSLFDEQTPYEQLLALTLGELRELLRIPLAGLSSEVRGVHAHAPALAITSR